MKTKPISDEWEKDFDEMWKVLDFEVCMRVKTMNTHTLDDYEQAEPDDIKDFIRKLITAQQTAHEAELEAERERIYEKFGITEDLELEKEQQAKQESIEKAIENNEVVYISQFGHIVTEEMYLEFEEWADSVMPMGEGHQKERFIRVNLSTLSNKDVNKDVI